MKTGAVILAAGVSEQMREPRPMLCLGKKTMLRHVVDALKQTGAGPIVVVTGYRAEAIRRSLTDCGVSFVHNKRYAETEMLDSLLLGLESIKAECDRVIVAPADVPLVEAGTLKALLRHTGQIIRPEFRGSPGHPIIVARELLPAMRDYSGENGLAGFVLELGIPVESVPVDDEGVLFDANTRADYDRLLTHEERLSGKGKLHVELDIKLSVEDAVMDAEMMQLLEMIEYTGSLQTASECVNRSYSKSWRRIKELERQLGVSILKSSAGGAKGGGSQLTEVGRGLLRRYKSMYEEGQRLANWLFAEHFSSDLYKTSKKDDK